MHRFELQNLLPAGTVTDRSRSEVLHELTSVSAGAGAPSSDVGGSGGAGLSGSGTAANSLSGILQGSTKDVTEQLSALTSQITTLSSTQQTHIGVTQDNTQAITQNTSAKSSGSSVGSTVGNLASSLLGGVLRLSPLFIGLMSLFGGSGSQSAISPVPFRLPAPVQADAGLTAGSQGTALPVSYGAGGQPRPHVSSPAQQINIQVSAMDSKSFLDHSDEIASAVKQALLSYNSLSEVISDL
jgi:hypothetical protein